jgi:fructosamine-3-kinase
MNAELIIREAFASLGASTGIEHTRLLAGDHAQQVLSVSLADGSLRIAKMTDADSGDRLYAEADGLKALRQTGFLLVPHCERVVDVHSSCVLIMDQLEQTGQASAETWRVFAEDLAAHHLSNHADRFGWHRNNYIGATPQINTWTENWVEFNANLRLGYQYSIAKHKLEARVSTRVECIIDRLSMWLPESPQPALLHGDLWSGNAITSALRIGVIDPAVYIGDAWADIAMLTLFGSPPSVFMDTYTQLIGEPQQLRERLLIYQLYHMLNHFNLFGESYAGSVNRICKQLV